MSTTKSYARMSIMEAQKWGSHEVVILLSGMFESFLLEVADFGDLESMMCAKINGIDGLTFVKMNRKPFSVEWKAAGQKCTFVTSIDQNSITTKIVSSSVDSRRVNKIKIRQRMEKIDADIRGAFYPAEALKAYPKTELLKLCTFHGVVKPIGASKDVIINRLLGQVYRK